MDEYNLNIKFKKRKIISDEIYDVLSKSIIRGEFKPGQTINTTIIAENMGVSRTPLREALKKLEQEGWLQSKNNGRKTIKKISLQDAIEIYEIRKALEVYLMDIIYNRISDAELEKLEDLINEELFYLNSNKVDRLKNILEANNRFHLFLYNVAGNKRLYSISRSLYENILHYRILNLKIPAYNRISINEHKEILDALKKKDAKLAKKIIKRHIESAKNMAISQFKDKSWKIVEVIINMID